VDIERANHGLSLKEVLNHFMHFVVFRAMILLKHPPWCSKSSGTGHDCHLCRRRELSQAFLLLQDRQYFVIDGVGELFILAWLGG
jgi:hypothetical protein